MEKAKLAKSCLFTSMNFRLENMVYNGQWVIKRGDVKPQFEKKKNVRKVNREIEDKKQLKYSDRLVRQLKPTSGFRPHYFRRSVHGDDVGGPANTSRFDASLDVFTTKINNGYIPYYPDHIPIIQFQQTLKCKQIKNIFP